MDVMERPRAADRTPRPAPDAKTAETPRSLAALLAELQALAAILPATDRSDEEIEAGFDNLPV